MKIEILRNLILRLFRRPFPGSENYWIRRYDSGANSGVGSLGRLAKFKAAIVNEFVEMNNIETIIEYGCGDGNQLKLAKYKSYIGFDVSQKAIDLCQNIFMMDKTKSFGLMAEYRDETAQLTISLDVIYHLIEDSVYFGYMERLFSSAKKFVIIYSSNYEEKDIKINHVRRRKFTEWVKINKPRWQVIEYIPNFRYSNIKGDERSRSDFYIYSNLVPK